MVPNSSSSWQKVSVRYAECVKKFQPTPTNLRTSAMRQTLFFIPAEIGGVPLFGPFSILLAIWLVGTIGFLGYQFYKQGVNKETLSFAPILLLLGGAIVWFLPFLATSLEGDRGLPIRGYGFMMLIGVVSSVWLATYRARRMGVDPENVLSLAFVMFVFGIVGARIFYVLQYYDQFLRPSVPETIGAIFSVNNGGLVVYGSVIGGLTAGIIFLRKRNLPMLALGDIVAPSMVLGLAFGRLGCLLNGCCFGGVCETAWAPSIEFPMMTTSGLGTPPYSHQKMQGQLHGVLIGGNQERPLNVLRVYPETIYAGDSARNSGITEGAELENIWLPLNSALRAAESIRWPEDAAIEVRLVDGRKLTIPIEHGEHANIANNVGFTLSSGFAAVDNEGPAKTAGLETGDEVELIGLPITSPKLAHEVMAYGGRPLKVTTVDEKWFDLTPESFPTQSLPVHPTQIYSSINAFLLASLLWVFYPFRRTDGAVFALLLVTYPVTRILLEVIRNDVSGLGGTAITPSQFISFCILLAGFALWGYLLRTPKKTAYPPQEQKA